MRDTKFRVWDEDAQEMVYGVGLTPGGIPYSIPDYAEASDQFDYYPSCHEMQFTGLRDKKGHSDCTVMLIQSCERCVCIRAATCSEFGMLMSISTNISISKLSGTFMKILIYWRKHIEAQ